MLLGCTEIANFNPPTKVNAQVCVSHTLGRCCRLEVFGDTWCNQQRPSFFMEKKENLHVGKMIEAYLKENGVSKVKFAKLIPCSRVTVYNILNNPNINTQTLQHICKVLNHDFFLDISCQHIQCKE